VNNGLRGTMSYWEAVVFHTLLSFMLLSLANQATDTAGLGALGNVLAMFAFAMAWQGARCLIERRTRCAS
jgi:hypothetical protein